jgi:hypothetical protein
MNAQTIAQITRNLDTMTQLLIQTRSMLENHRPGAPSIQSIYRAAVEHVASSLDVNPDKLTGKCRLRHYVDARWCLWTILHQTFCVSRIAETCSVDHSAVSHGIESLADYLRLSKDPHAQNLRHTLATWREYDPSDPDHADLLKKVTAVSKISGLLAPDISWSKSRLQSAIELHESLNELDKC